MYASLQHTRGEKEEKQVESILLLQRLSYHKQDVYIILQIIYIYKHFFCDQCRLQDD